MEDNIEVIPSLVEAQIRNTAATDELEHYEQTKEFIFKHPFTLAYKKRLQFDEEIVNKTPEQLYLDINTNASLIRRYKSELARLDPSNFERRTYLETRLQIAENKRVKLLEILGG